MKEVFDKNANKKISKAQMKVQVKKVMEIYEARKANK